MRRAIAPAVLVLAVGCGTKGGEVARERTPPAPPSPAAAVAAALPSPAPAPPKPCPDVTAFVAALPPTDTAPPAFLDLAAGFDQTCAITTTRAVVCWGTTWSGARHLPEELAWKALPIELPKGYLPVEIDAGDSGGCVRGADATVACWGTPRPNGNAFVAAAARTPRVRGATSIAVGHRGACAVTRRGEVWCWGEGWHHDLGGSGYEDPAEDAIRVPHISDAVEVAVEQQRACARLAGGQVTCWGNGNLPAVLAGVGDAVAIDLEGDRACAARSNGELVCWKGVAQTPDLRRMHVTPHGESVDLPPLVDPTPFVVPGIAGAVDVALGERDCVRDRAGTVTCWDDLATIAQPAAGIAAARLSGGPRHSCVLDATGTGWCWGSDEARQLGARVRLSSSTPVEMCGIDEVVEVGTGTAFTCVRQRSGAVACAGTNRENTIERSYLAVSGASRPTGLTDATMLSVAANHSCAVRPGGKAHCWGKAELPFNLAAAWLHPGNQTFAVDGIATVAAGTWRDCARLTDGGVACWAIMGRTSFGWDEIPPPARVPAIADAQVLAGTCALERSGRVVCWGDDFVAPQLPPAASTDSDKLRWAQLHPPEATARTVWTNARSLAVGEGAACAILGDDLHCEGVAPLSVPASLASGGAANVTSFAAGGGRACVIDRTGAVDCWTLARTDPPLERVPGLTDAIAVSLSRTHACALRRGGTVVCWGGDERGQLGAGPEPRAPTAVRVEVVVPRVGAARR